MRHASRFTHSRRSVILSTSIVLLNIAWICLIAIFDLSKLEFKEDWILWFQKLSSYWLNLLWSLAVPSCLRHHH